LSMDEDIIGVIWGQSLHHGPGFGYALLITSRRIVGAKKGTYTRALVRYLGPGSNATQEDRKKAEGVALEIEQEKEFEMAKDEISEISYKSPGFFFGGHVVFNTAQESIKLTLPSLLVNPNVSYLWKDLIRSLTNFGSGKLYNEKTKIQN
jgi:hypothetical protein